MRALASSFTAALALIALLWGNCLSCPQMLAASAEKAHSCCHRHQAPTSSAKCQSQGLQNFVKADDGAQPHAAPAAIAPAEPAAIPLVAASFDVPALSSHAPPDPLPLVISLRI